MIIQSKREGRRLAVPPACEDEAAREIVTFWDNGDGAFLILAEVQHFADPALWGAAVAHLGQQLIESMHEGGIHHGEGRATFEQIWQRFAEGYNQAMRGVTPYSPPPDKA